MITCTKWLAPIQTHPLTTICNLCCVILWYNAIIMLLHVMYNKLTYFLNSTLEVSMTSTFQAFFSHTKVCGLIVATSLLTIEFECWTQSKLSCMVSNSKSCMLSFQVWKLGLTYITRYINHLLGWPRVVWDLWLGTPCEPTLNTKWNFKGGDS